METTGSGMLMRYLRATAALLVLWSIQDPLARAQQEQNTGSDALPVEKRSQATETHYILGPGDLLEIEFLDLPELSGKFAIGPDGNLHLPRRDALNVVDLTVEELRDLLIQKFNTSVLNPQVYVRTILFRPIRVYVGGEVKRPGFYTLSGQSNLELISQNTERKRISSTNVFDTAARVPGSLGGREYWAAQGGTLSASWSALPTVFDAIRAAQGITPYSNLSEVEVTRKRSRSLGGGHIRTNLNFLSLITEGKESQNIRLLDNDVVTVSRSTTVMHEQLFKAGQTNLSPQFIGVYVAGRVKDPGSVNLPQGSTLTQAITLAGGPKLLKGRVEFVRFTSDGKIDRRIFPHRPSAPPGARDNPVLMSGDLINIKESPLSTAVSVLNEITTPMMGIYSTYSLLEAISE